MSEELERIDTSEASKMADYIASKMFGESASTTTTAPPPDSTSTVEVEAATEEVDQQQGQEEVTGAQQEEVVEELEAHPQLAEVKAALEEVGLDVAMPEEVPEELVPAYSALAKRVADMAKELIEQQVEARQAIENFNQFREQLEKSPDRVLLTLAVSHPEVFRQVGEVLNRMESDPTFKEAVIRELQSEVRLREADRKLRALTEQQLLAKARRVTAATRMYCERYGVSPRIAEEVIASVIERQGDIDLADVEEIVKELAPKPRQVTKVVSKKTAVPKAQTSAAAAASTATGKEVPQPSSGLKPAGGPIRSIIDNAMRKLGV